MSASHSRTVGRRWRWPAGARRAERHTSPVGVPVSGLPTGWPVSAFHSRTVPSPLAVASRCPSGLNATPFTAPVWPVMILAVLARWTTAV